MISNWKVFGVGYVAKPVFLSLEVSNIPLKSGSILPRSQNDHITRLWRRDVYTKLWKSWPTRGKESVVDTIAWLVARIRQVARICRTLKLYLCTIFLLRMMFAKNGRHLFADTERISSLRRRLPCVLPSRRCIVPFPVIIQPDECHVNHCKQREIRLARSH